MATAFRKFTKRIFITLNIFLAVLFLLACVNAYLPPEHWWFIAILGLSFPFLLLLVVFFFFFWLFFRSKWLFLSFGVLLIGFMNIRSLIGFNFATRYTPAKKEGVIRLLTWNVNRFTESRQTNRLNPYTQDILKIIKQQQPDVLCFQEFLEPDRTAGMSLINNFEEQGYKYHYVVSDYSRRNGTYQVGVAIFSRHPILDSIRIQYQGPKAMRAAESLIACDIECNGKKIRVYNTHLQSIMLQKKDYHDLEIIKNAQDSMVEASKSIVRKLKQGYRFRDDQVEIVRTELDRSPYPEIICGDFNDVPNSYTYFRIKGSRKDAFVEKGRWFGRTYSNLSPTLRIDYVMTDEIFEILQYKRLVQSYSEHYPIIVDVRLK